MTVRVRFAPSPTGFMHLGNVRAAVLNYLFARQKNGSFILRIEDTDASRNLDEAKVQILKDLAWLTLSYNEGPVKEGPHSPYVQSERSDIYQTYLAELIANCKVYRCFCTPEELEAVRQKQLAMGKPPRYNRTCLNYSDDKIKLKLVANRPFIWRLKLNPDQIFEINDMARGTITFDMKNFGDFALTRPDGSCTFMFVNFIDDWLMKITHVIRGEDHLTNTALQAALYDAFAVPLPVFWHLQIICNEEGSKLSKRDFGFSLADLQAAGFLPEAVCNYVASIGVSLEHEVQSLEELAESYNFEHLHAAGTVRYDLNKLTWFNHTWINRISDTRFYAYAKPFLNRSFPASTSISEQTIELLLSKIKSNLQTLNDIAPALDFYFNKPVVSRQKLDQSFGAEKVTTILAIIKNFASEIASPNSFLQKIKHSAQEHGIKTKELFCTLRYILTGTLDGIGIQDLFAMLNTQEITDRIHSCD